MGSESVARVRGASGKSTNSAGYCPSCGRAVPEQWPEPSGSHCESCNAPLGLGAYENDVLSVRRSLSIFRAGTLTAGFVSLGFFLLLYVTLIGDIGQYANAPALPPMVLATLQQLTIVVIVAAVACLALSRIVSYKSPRLIAERGIRSGRLGFASHAARWLLASDSIVRSRLELVASLGIVNVNKPVGEPPASIEKSEDWASEASRAHKSGFTAIWAPRAWRLRRASIGAGDLKGLARPRRSFAGVAALVIVMLLVLFLALMPLPTSYTRQVATVTLFTYQNTPAYDSSYPGYLDLVANSSVSGTWSSSNGQPVTFMLLSNCGANVVNVLAASGSFAFVGSCPPYYIIAVSALPGSVTVTGTANQAIIAGLTMNS